MIPLKKSANYWNYEKCKLEAEKYNSRVQFKKGSNSAYRFTLKNKWMNDFFPK